MNSHGLGQHAAGVNASEPDGSVSERAEIQKSKAVVDTCPILNLEAISKDNHLQIEIWFLPSESL